MKRASGRSGVGEEEEETVLIILNTNFFWNASLFFSVIK
jgi:hypothetical protein